MKSSRRRRRVVGVAVSSKHRKKTPRSRQRRRRLCGGGSSKKKTPAAAPKRASKARSSTTTTTTTVLGARGRAAAGREEEEEEEGREESEEEQRAARVRREREDAVLAAQCAAALRSLGADNLSKRWGYSSTRDHTNFEKQTGDQNMVPFQVLTDYFMRPLSHIDDDPYPVSRFVNDAKVLVPRLLNEIQLMISDETKDTKLSLLSAEKRRDYAILLDHYYNSYVENKLEELAEKKDDESWMSNKFLKYFILGAENMMSLKRIFDPGYKIDMLGQIERNLIEAVSPFMKR